MKVKSRTKIKEQSRRKNSPILQETLKEALKHEGWRVVAGILSGSSRNYRDVNVFEIDEEFKAGDTIIIVGKVLSKGELTKKVRICALGFSEKAKEKIREKKGEIVSILEEIKKNPKAEGIKIWK